MNEQFKSEGMMKKAILRSEMSRVVNLSQEMFSEFLIAEYFLEMQS